jgi:peptide deformylase
MNKETIELKNEYTTNYIVDYPDPGLSLNLFTTEEAEELKKSFDPKKVQSIAVELTSMMLKSGGVGLAANQVNCKYPIFVVNDGINPIEAFILPKIVSTNGKVTNLEACLSCGSKTVPVERPYEIVIEYYNILGQKKKKKRHGYSARIISHEMDHLEGKCISDLISEGSGV